MMQNTILVRVETSPEDINGMHAAKGILTSRGGMTSHAAVVARGMGRPCVSGCSEIEIDYDKKIFKIKNIVVKEGDVITIDGSTGRIILGDVFFVLLCLCNQMGINLTNSLNESIDKKTKRDINRHKENKKLL